MATAQWRLPPAGGLTTGWFPSTHGRRLPTSPVTFTRFGDRELAIADTIAARLGAYADEYDLEGIAQELIVELDDGSVEVSVLPHDCFFAVAARYARDAIPAGGWRS